MLQILFHKQEFFLHSKKPTFHHLNIHIIHGTYIKEQNKPSFSFQSFYFHTKGHFCFLYKYF